MDYYRILDVNPDASLEDIKKAFKKKALQFHPDLNPNKEESKKLFLLCKTAYDVLSNVESRQKYDATRNISKKPTYNKPYNHQQSYYNQNKKNNFYDTTYDDFYNENTYTYNTYGYTYSYTYSYEKREYVNEEKRNQEEAWQKEKEEAEKNKERNEKLRQRTETAHKIRRGITLRKFWQSHSRFTWQDGIILCFFIFSSSNIIYFWTFKNKKSINNQN